MKQAIIAILLVAGIIGGAVIFGKDNGIKGELSSHVYGKTDSAVTLLEYGDFECPACAFFFPIAQEIKEKYKDQISFQFKNFPLVQSHQNALAAHRAAEAAGKQNKFWEMHDLLYGNQEEWNGPSQSDPVGIPTDQAIALFEKYAEGIGLDMDQFRTDVNDSNTVGTINADTAEGKSKFNVTGTPTFILNGTKIDDTTSIDSVEEFSAIIDAALGNQPEESTEQPAETPAKSEEESTDL